MEIKKMWNFLGIRNVQRCIRQMPRRSFHDEILTRETLRKKNLQSKQTIFSSQFSSICGFYSTSLTKHFPNNMLHSNSILSLKENPLYFQVRTQGTSSEQKMNVFDRKAKQLQRDRAAIAPDVKVFDYLKDEVAYRLVDRLRDVTRKFDIALDLGSGRGHVAKHLNEELVGSLYQCELSHKMLDQGFVCEDVETIKLQADEEFIPFQENSLDLVLSNLSLHWVNDLPGCLRQIYDCLKPDGAFIGVMFGGDTLFELRCSLQLAEQERQGGISAHVSPFTDLRDLGSLLTRAAFKLLTVDVDEVTVNYPSMFELMSDLKGMAENNASWSRKLVHRETLAAAAAIYKDMYGNTDGSIPATYELYFMIGWKPDKSQAQPLKRGSAKLSLKDIGKDGT